MHATVPLRLKKAQKQLAYIVPCSVLHGLTSVIGGGVVAQGTGSLFVRIVANIVQHSQGFFGHIPLAKDFVNDAGGEAGRH